MAQTFTWTGAALGDWFSGSDWTPSGPPPEGSVALIDTAAGPAIGAGDPTVDDVAIILAAGAKLTTSGGTLGAGVTLTNTSGYTTLSYPAASTFDATFNFAPGLTQAQLNVTGDADATLTIGQAGALTATTDTGIILSTGTVNNNGTLNAAGGLVSVYSGALTGNGTVTISKGGQFYSNEDIGAGQTVAFLDQTGLLQLYDATLGGTITNFQAGNEIILGGVTADAVSYDAKTETLNVTDQGTIVASLHLAFNGDPAGLSTRFSQPGDAISTVITASDATRVWNGGTADWYAAANWTSTPATPASFPLAGDTVRITAGTARIDRDDVLQYGTIDAENIILNGTSGAPATLVLSDDTIGPNAVLETNGQKQFGRLQIEGTVTLNGIINSQSRAGRLTIDLENNGTLVNGTEGSILSSTPAGLVFDGTGTFVNNGIVVAQGGLFIGQGVTFVNDGAASQGRYNVVRLQHGGRATIEGTFQDNAIEFGDSTGYLTIDNLAGFQGAVWNMNAGNRIDLPNQQVASVSYDLDSVELSLLDSGGNEIGQIAVITADGFSGFNVAPDGHGGSLITYTPTLQVLQPALPVPLVALPGTTVALQDLLIQAFGTIPAAYANADLGLSYASKTDLHDWNFSYWKLSEKTVTEWLLDGKALPAMGSDVLLPPNPPTKEVAGSKLGDISLKAGNAILPGAILSVPIGGTAENPTSTAVYWIQTVDPNVASPTIYSGIVDPQDIVDSAMRFASYYGNVPNSNDCGWIGDDVAAAAGASMPQQDQSTDPTANVSGGFWRVVYRGSDEQNPIQNWSSLVEAGDIVRMAWADGFYGQHTTTVLGKNDDGTIRVYDNMALVPGVEGSTIGIHDAAYWTDTLAAATTIYRLDPNHQYLVQGSSAAEFLQGSTYDNLFQPGAGGDTIAGGPGQDEIQGSGTDLSGDTVLAWDLGDSLDITDMAVAGAVADYDPTSGVLSVSNVFSGATVDVMLPAGLAFDFQLAADAGGGGTQVTVSCFASGTLLRTPDGDVAVEDLAVGDTLLAGTGEDRTPRPIRWIGHRSVDISRHPRPQEVQPVRIAAHTFGRNLPERPLVLSPDHALYIDGALIPVRYLVNGRQIRRLTRKTVTYWHVELDRHDVVLAEGLPVESYLDTGDRANFANGGRVVALHPDFASRIWEAAGCAPLLVTGPKLAAVRRRLDQPTSRRTSVLTGST